MKSLTVKAAQLRVGVVMVVLLVSAVRAEIKNFTFQGTISTVEDMQFVLDGSITNGTAIEGFYIFETGASDSNSDPTVGDYRYTNNTFGIVVKAGSYVFRTNPRHVDFLMEVVNRAGGDNYLLRSYNNVCSQPLMVDHIAWQLDDFSGAALGDDLLPSKPPTLAAWQSVFGLTVSGAFFLRGSIDSISEAPAVIPERPTVTLGEAVEISRPSRLGYFYQLQSSEDMQSWTNIGEPVLGDGSVLSKFVSSQHGKTIFYRAEIANFSR
jgi:hypothetical protein